MRNHHATVLNTATWAREFFGKTFSLNSLPPYQEMPLESHARRKLYICSMQRSCHVLRLSKRQWKWVLCSDESTFQLVFWKNWLFRVLSPWNMKRTIQTVISDRWKSKHLSWYRDASVQTAWMGDSHVCEGIDVET